MTDITSGLNPYRQYHWRISGRRSRSAAPPAKRGVGTVRGNCCGNSSNESAARGRRSRAPVGCPSPLHATAATPHAHVQESGATELNEHTHTHTNQNHNKTFKNTDIFCILNVKAMNQEYQTAYFEERRNTGNDVAVTIVGDPAKTNH